LKLSCFQKLKLHLSLNVNVRKFGKCMTTRLWCAGILCPHPELKRIHVSCPYCRWRRKYYGKFIEPAKWIFYTVRWKKDRYAVMTRTGKIVGYMEAWTTIKIDPRGHFTRLRCSAIMVLDRIVEKCLWIKKPLMEFMEFLANYPTF
jgi:hypothetical protein